ncbi:hypothetical protein ACIQXQ_20095 [Peribacillus sp. NPDC097198]|uniref:hypothetical protein n=1 Tax=Peribacillus sp. NPDC097198 TaxID=3364397 RepID=UPI0038044702
MYSLGIRVSVPEKLKKGKIFYAVVKLDDNSELEIIKSHYLVIPSALEVPEQLAFIRTNFLAIVMQYNIKLAGLRVTETVAKNQIVFRMHIEGVFQELFANSSIEKYDLLNIVKMAGLLEMKREDIKSCIQEKDIFLEIENWLSYKKEERECIIAATSMLQMEVASC